MNIAFIGLFMSDRVLNRRGARELKPEEMDQVAGGLPLHTLCGVPPHFFRDDDSIS